MGTDETSLELSTVGRSADLWGAISAAAPEIAADAGRLGGSPRVRFSDYPGLRNWLLVQFALNVPPQHIQGDLDLIVADQKEEGRKVVWPVLTRRQLTVMRVDQEHEWQPLAAQLTNSIANVGVLAKNKRLLALLQLAERLNSKIWDERNSRTDQLYLIPEYRAVLRQIAEEKGELGERGDLKDEALLKMAEALAGQLKVQGSGIQVSDVEEYDYDIPGEVVPFKELDEAP